MSDVAPTRQYPADVLKGARVELRRHEVSEAFAGACFAQIDADRKHLGEFLTWVDRTKTVADSLKYLTDMAAKWNAFEVFDYGMFTRGPTGSLQWLGNIGAHHIDWDNGSAELGYWIGSAFVGSGYVTEAVGILERELFRLGFWRVRIRCVPENARSAAVAKRSGYRYEGTHRGDRIEFGKRGSTMVFAKLANDKSP